jgi:hypothetical protein
MTAAHTTALQAQVNGMASGQEMDHTSEGGVDDSEVMRRKREKGIVPVRRLEISQKTPPKAKPVATMTAATLLAVTTATAPSATTTGVPILPHLPKLLLHRSQELEQPQVVVHGPVHMSRRKSQVLWHRTRHLRKRTRGRVLLCEMQSSLLKKNEVMMANEETVVDGFNKLKFVLLAFNVSLPQLPLIL